MRLLVRVTEGLANIAGYIGGWLVPLMTLLILIEVVMRYVVHQPLMISDEFSAYMLVALAYIGLAYTWKEKSHVRISLLVNRLPTRVADWLRLATLGLGFAFVSLLIKLGYDYLAFSFKVGMVSSSWLRTPMQWPQMILPIGFFLLALVIIGDIAKVIANIRSGIKPEEKDRWI